MLIKVDQGCRGDFLPSATFLAVPRSMLGTGRGCASAPCNYLTSQVTFNADGLAGENEDRLLAKEDPFSLKTWRYNCMTM